MVSYILLRLCRMGWGLEIEGVETIKEELEKNAEERLSES